MSSKRSIVAGLALAGLSTGATVALALPGSATAGTPTTGTFTVRAHQRSAAHLDLGRTGVSAGDEDLISGVLTRDGAQVGSLAGTCQAVRYRQHGAVQLCEFDLRFGTAQLTSSGMVVAGRNGPGTFTMPITGGTGRYLGAAGQLAVTATSGAALPITVTLVG
jgi:hypothetical protein